MSVLAGKITDSELEVMKVLWEAGDALPITDLRTALQARRGWEATTVKTLVSRLVTKGALSQEKRKVFYYRPLIGQEEYSDWAAQDLVDRLFKGSARNLVATLFKSEGLSAEDLAELRDLFRVEG